MTIIIISISRPPTAIVFDDVIMNKDLREVENWFVKNRHSNTSVFFLTQGTSSLIFFSRDENNLN